HVVAYGPGERVIPSVQRGIRVGGEPPDAVSSTGATADVRRPAGHGAFDQGFPPVPDPSLTLGMTGY
ncbi:MAG: hypothetical protein ACRD2J_03830, partial [Thermoanaerobaculia bacterium]